MFWVGILKMKRFFIALAMIAAVSMFATDAIAAQCYSPREFEAEQGLRIHSELMVISLTCMKMPNGSGMYQKYQSFTTKNKNLLSGYEEDMISYFRAQGASSPEKQFHTLRTSLANQISQHAIKMSTGSFCQHFANRIDSALAMNQEKLRRWAQQPWPNSPTSKPMCGGQVAQR